MKVGAELFDLGFTLALCHLDCAERLHALVENKLDALAHFPNAQFMVIDNGSTDGSLSLLAQMAKEQPKIQWVVESQRGIYYVRRRAILECRDPFLIMVDDDVQLDETVLMELLLPLVKDDSVGLVGARVDLEWHAPQPVWLADKLLNQFRTDVEKTRFRYESTAFPCFPTGVAKAIRLGPCAALFSGKPRSVNYPLGRKRADVTRGLEAQDLGGEDIDLAEIFASNGYQVLFSNYARVLLDVPAERLTPEWFRARCLADGRTRIRLLKFTGRSALGRHGIRFILGLIVLAPMIVLVPFVSKRLGFLWSCYLAKAWGAWAEWLAPGPSAPWPYRIDQTRIPMPADVAAD